MWGANRLDEARRSGELTIVEGASDFQTLSYYEIAVYAIPGASSWSESGVMPRAWLVWIGSTS